MNLTIESDGTKAGTKVMIDGMQIQNLSSIEFWLDRYSSAPELSYSTTEENKEKHARITTNYSFDQSIAKIVKTNNTGSRTLDTKDYEKM